MEFNKIVRLGRPLNYPRHRLCDVGVNTIMNKAFSLGDKKDVLDNQTEHDFQNSTKSIPILDISKVGPSSGVFLRVIRFSFSYMASTLVMVSLRTIGNSDIFTGIHIKTMFGSTH